MDENTRVLLLGHSFISRLDRELGSTLPEGFNLKQCDIRCFGVSGGRAESFVVNQDTRLRRVLHSFQPAVLILQIGGNDLNDPDTRPETVACHIVELMECLMSYKSIKVGVVCELFIRHRPRGISPQAYEEKRLLINRMLPTFLSASDYNHMFFWKHRRLMNSPLNVLGEDGVHLSELGYKKFYRSLRLAILHALELIE